MIEVRRTGEGDPLKFEVDVREGRGETRHHITMDQETCERLTGGKHTPELCVEATFRFLLDREPKESILGRFDVTVISRYFPEFERELPRYVSRSQARSRQVGRRYASVSPGPYHQAERRHSARQPRLGQPPLRLPWGCGTVDQAPAVGRGSALSCAGSAGCHGDGASR
jgi:hypothetical protein